MARKQHSELVAGTFVILALVVVVGVIIWVGGAGIFKQARQQAVFFRNEADGGSGLMVGSIVQVGDDRVGQISAIHFDPASGRTYYSAALERGDFKVHADAKARVASGLVGGSQLTILSLGTDRAPLADKDNAIEIAGGLDQAMADLGSAISKLSRTVEAELSADDPKAILSQVHSAIGSLKGAASDVAQVAMNIKAETIRSNHNALLAKIHKSMDDLNVISSQVRGEVDVKTDKPLLAKLHASMDDINAMTADARPKVSEALTNIRAISRDVRQYVEHDIADIVAKLREANTRIVKISGDLSAVSGQIRQTVAMHRDNIDELVDNMVAVSANLKAASKEIRRNPWRLLYKPDNEELNSANIRAAATAFSNGAEQLDQAINKLNGLAKSSPGGIPANDPTLIRVRKHLQETFDQFSKAEDALWKEVQK